MMKFAAPILVVFGLVCLTDPNGHDAWLVPSQVVTVVHPAGDCDPRANAKVTLGNGAFVCVRESVKNALSKLDPH